MELEAQFEPNGGGGGGAVDSVNGQTGDVVLDAGDLGYDDEETYTSGTVGKEISNLKGGLTEKYTKPSGGIPSTDMTSEVQTSLGKADSAYQKPSGGIPASDLAEAYMKTTDYASSSQIKQGNVLDKYIPKHYLVMFWISTFHPQGKKMPFFSDLRRRQGIVHRHRPQTPLEHTPKQHSQKSARC